MPLARVPKNSPEPVPFVDLAPQNRPLAEHLRAALVRVLEHEQFINGPEVERFERAVAGFLGAEHAVGVSSGTDALLVTLMALGVGPGCEVITSPFTFVATASVIARLGARPVFADILPRTYELRPGAVREALTASTRAVVAVHLFGRLGAVEELQRLCAERGLPLIEDCAQAFGARRGGRAAGTFGLAGAFSFFPTKNLGALGDGGLVVTADPALADKVRRLRDQGRSAAGRYDSLGGNFRLDTLQAALLEAKLGRLGQWLEERRQAAARYTELLAEAELCPRPDQTVHPGHRLLPPEAPPEPAAHSFNLYVVEAERRDELMAFLQKRGIATRIYYPRPLHLEGCFVNLGYREGDFPVAEEASRRVLALPFYPGITAEQQQRVVEAVREFYSGSKR